MKIKKKITNQKIKRIKRTIKHAAQELEKVREYEIANVELSTDKKKHLEWMRETEDKEKNESRIVTRKEKKVQELNNGLKGDLIVQIKKQLTVNVIINSYKSKSCSTKKMN